MKFLRSLFILLITCYSLSAQETGGGVGSGIDLAIIPTHLVNQQFFDDAFNGKYSDKPKYFDIEGSPFLNDDPINGTLVMNDGKKLENVPLQFDLYANEFIANTVRGELIFLNKKHFQEIIIPIDGKDVSFRKINEEKPDQFYEILFINRDLIFFKHMFVTRKEAFSNGISKSPAQFSNRVKYYIKYPNEEIKKVKLKKKKMFEGFKNEDVKAMKDYAKANKIKFKNEYDFAAVFEAVLK